MQPGGYCWWYLDCLSEDRRTGIVVIAFVGSVFSPFYANARRRGQGVADPLAHCAINVALYRRFRSRWVFTERSASAVTRTPDQLAIGPSSIGWENGELWVRFDERTAPWGGRLRGTIRLIPSCSSLETRGGPVRLDAAARHRWWPCAPVARAEVSLDRPRLQFSGTAYHDSNEGDEPLERGFSSWTWSRAELSQGTAVLYDVIGRDKQTQQHGWIYGRDGSVSPLQVAGGSRLRRSLWLLPRHTRHDAGARARIARTWEDTPFYTRQLVSTTLAGEPALLVHETLDLRRFATPWVRWMLPYRMRHELGPGDEAQLLTDRAGQ